MSTKTISDGNFLARTTRFHVKSDHKKQCHWHRHQSILSCLDLLLLFFSSSLLLFFFSSSSLLQLFLLQCHCISSPTCLDCPTPTHSAEHHAFEPPMISSFKPIISLPISFFLYYTQYFSYHGHILFYASYPHPLLFAPPHQRSDSLQGCQAMPEWTGWTRSWRSFRQAR